MRSNNPVRLSITDNLLIKKNHSDATVDSRVNNKHRDNVKIGVQIIFNTAYIQKSWSKTIPGDSGCTARYLTLATQRCTLIHTHIMGNSEKPVDLICKSLDGGRKPGEHANFTQKGSPG